MEMIKWLLENGQQLLEAAAKIVAGAAILSTFTKTNSDNKLIDKLGSVLDFFGGNFGKAANDPTKNN